MRTRSSAGLERHTTDVEVIGSNPVGSAIYSISFPPLIKNKSRLIRHPAFPLPLAILAEVTSHDLFLIKGGKEMEDIVEATGFEPMTV